MARRSVEFERIWWTQANSPSMSPLRSLTKMVRDLGPASGANGLPENPSPAAEAGSAARALPSTTPAAPMIRCLRLAPAPMLIRLDAIAHLVRISNLLATVERDPAQCRSRQTAIRLGR